MSRPELSRGAAPTSCKANRARKECPGRKGAPDKEECTLTPLRPWNTEIWGSPGNRSKATLTPASPSPPPLLRLPSRPILFRFLRVAPEARGPSPPCPRRAPPSHPVLRPFLPAPLSSPFRFLFRPRSPSSFLIGRAHRSLVVQSASWAGDDGRGRDSGALRSRLPPPLSRQHIPPPLPPPGPAVVFAGAAVALGLGRGGAGGERRRRPRRRQVRGGRKRRPGGHCSSGSGPVPGSVGAAWWLGRIPRGPGGGRSHRPGHGGQRETGQPTAQEFQEQRPRLRGKLGGAGGVGALGLGPISAGTPSVGSRGGCRRRAAGEWRWGPARP